MQQLDKEYLSQVKGGSAATLLRFGRGVMRAETTGSGADRYPLGSTPYGSDNSGIMPGTVVG